MPKTVRVLIVEDDPHVREDLVHVVERHSALTLAASFGAAEPALRALSSGLEVDVALVDLGLPRMSGQDLIRRIRALRSDIETVVLTVFEDDESILGAIRAGASGYLLKDVTPAALGEAVLQVHGGGAPMSPSIARRVLFELRDEVPARESPLSARERDVLELLTKGASYPEIGNMLSITLNTVQSHIRAIYRKLDVGTKAEATAKAFRRGMFR
jgi:DNA-binding NarL/FixJ family response regulator